MRAEFRAQFGKEDVMVRSPGRINLIGEHTDYNGGFALPAAATASMWLALRHRDDNVVRLSALDLRRTHEGTIGDVRPGPGRWPQFVLGVVAALRDYGVAFGGFDLAYASDMPPGSGMSSSMALACGLIYGVAALSDARLPRAQIARIARVVEERYVGTRCGGMDPAAILFGVSNHVLLLDCRSLSAVSIAFPADEVAIVLCDSQIERGAVESLYNDHRTLCENVVRILHAHDPHVRSLRDVTRAALEEHRGELGAKAYHRARYVVEENDRVLRAAAALSDGDLATLGKLLYASHEGLRRQYEVSCREIDVLVEAASLQEGAIGARMMGTGFGGCTINLVRKSALASFEEGMAAVFRRRLNCSPRMYRCALGKGVERVA